MKLKTFEVNGKHYAELDEKGQPIYVVGEGEQAKEIGFDAPGAQAKIAGLNREAQGHREAYEGVMAKYEPFKDLKPEDVAEALKVKSNLSSGELKTVAQVEEIRQQAQKVAEQQVADTARQSAGRISELEKSLQDITGALYDEKVGGAFSRSKFVNEKVAVPPDMLRATFGKHFKVENGQIVPYGADGNKIWSQVRAGEVADFEEGLERLIHAYPYKDNVLKGTNQNGTGAKQGAGGGTGKDGKPTIGRQNYEALSGAEKGQVARTHQIVDA